MTGLNGGGRRKVVLREFQDTERDKGALDIEMPDGTIVTVDPPSLWPDAAIPLFRDEDITGAVAAILGDQHEAFIAGGGSAAQLMVILESEHGDLGESQASSAS